MVNNPSNNSAKEKWACITGAAKRVGAQVAQELAKAGYNLILHFNSSKQEARTLAADIQKIGQKTILLQGDLLDPSFPETFMSQIANEISTLDILINNASAFQLDSLRSLTIETYAHNMTVNLQAPIFLAQSYARHFKNGHIINILDRAITTTKTDQLSYLLSKKCLEDFTYLAAKSLAPDIRVNAIAPGWILAPIHKQNEAEPPNIDTQKKLEKVPLSRQGRPQDVAQAILFLEQMTYTTGQCIFVDGGKHL